VEDLVDAHFLALDYLKQGNPSAAFNLGNGQGFSNLEIIEAARQVTGAPIPVIEEGRRPGDPAVLVASSKKAMEILGWRPKHADIHDIISSAWRWHTMHPEGYAD
jgi:UDP-glucose 4-epimerase